MPRSQGPSRSRLAVAVACAALSACRCERDRDRGPEMPPLASPAPSAALPVTGFGPAVVSVPVGATRARPVVVAVLGIGDSPDDQCATWRDIVGARAFVLCPRGAPNFVVEAPEDAGAEREAEGDPPGDEDPRRDASPTGPSRRQVGFFPVDLSSVDREVKASLAALKARYGAYVAEREVLYAGFSRGAFLGASLAARSPERFRRLVLVEGGQTPWNPGAASAFARGGGARVLFACGQPKCVEDAEAAASTLRAAKIEARVVHGAGEGHGYRRQVKEEIRRSLSWIVDGDPAWRD